MTILSVCMILPSIFNGLTYLPLAIVGLIPLVFGLALFYGGGSVSFGVQTAVQLVVLDGVNSRRKAKKVVRLLAVEVEQVQGVVSASMLQAALEKDAYAEKVTSRQKESAFMPPSSESSPIHPSTEP